MTLMEFYEIVGGNYNDVMGRLMTEQRVKKYLYKLSASGDYEAALEALKSENWQDFFRFTHNLKGISLNLGLSSLARASATACDLVRNGPPSESPAPYMEDVTRIYTNILSQIDILKAEEE